MANNRLLLKAHGRMVTLAKYMPGEGWWCPPNVLNLIEGLLRQDDDHSLFGRTSCTLEYESADDEAKVVERMARAEPAVTREVQRRMADLEARR